MCASRASDTLDDMQKTSSSCSPNATNPAHWKYLSEGGATIVYSYAGPYDTRFTGTVLRCRKTTKGGSHPDSDDDDRSVDFQSQIILKLLDQKYLPRLQSVSVDPSWLSELQQISESDRPLERRLEGTLDHRRSKVVITENLVGSSGWVAEIKPKWGFLPNPAHLSDETRDAKERHCRFCMHAQYKLNQGLSTASRFCPLDLYSRDTMRMKDALRGLWHGWKDTDGAINNLRLFVNGSVVDPNDSYSMDSLRRSMKARHDKLPVDLAAEDPQNSFIYALLSLLQRVPILQILSQMQRDLDPLDIEGLHALYQRVVHTQCPFPESLEQPSLRDWAHFIHQYQDCDFQAALHHDNPDPNHFRYYTLAYLMSATFKDCSLILHFPQNENDEPSATVIDMDVKSIRRLELWRNLDRDIATSFNSGGSQECKGI